jgi:hypothetical protein
MTIPVTASELAAAKTLRQAIWDAAHAQTAPPAPGRGGSGHHGAGDDRDAVHTELARFSNTAFTVTCCDDALTSSSA